VSLRDSTAFVDVTASGRTVGWVRLVAIILAIAAVGLGAWLVVQVVAASDPNPVCVANDPDACTSIDGYPIGLRLDCPAAVDTCAAELRLTRLGLDTFAPNHPDVQRVALFDVDLRRVCAGVLCTFSGGMGIVVFDLSDGTKRAIGYECPGIAPCRATKSWHDFDDAVALPT
jgi:hypothetical protein